VTVLESRCQDHVPDDTLTPGLCSHLVGVSENNVQLAVGGLDDLRIIGHLAVFGGVQGQTELPIHSVGRNHQVEPVARVLRPQPKPTVAEASGWNADT